MHTDSYPAKGATRRDLVLMTPDEAAQMLRLSKASVYRLVEMRALTFYRVSGSLRFSSKDLEDYLARGRVESVK